MSATNIRPPIGVSTTLNEFNVLKFTAETTHKVNPLPAAWQGKWVTMYVTGGNLHYAISKKSDAEVDRAVAASDTGASTKVGGVLTNGATTMFRLPYATQNINEALHFAREADVASSVVYMWLSDEPGTVRAP